MYICLCFSNEEHDVKKKPKSVEEFKLHSEKYRTNYSNNDDENIDQFLEEFRLKSYSANETTSTVSLAESQISATNRLWRSFKSKYINRSAAGRNDSMYRRLPLYQFPNDFKTGTHSFFTPPDILDPNNHQTVVIFVSGSELALVDFINSLINYVYGTNNTDQVRLVNKELSRSPITTFEINWRPGFAVESNLFIIAATQTGPPESFLGLRLGRLLTALTEYLNTNYPKGVTLSAFCSVLRHWDKSSFKIVAQVAEEILNIPKLTVASDKWFVFLNANRAKMPTSLSSPKLELITKFILANAQLVNFRPDQQSRCDLFANIFETLETYNFSFALIKSEHNFNTTTRSLLVLCARLNKIFTNKRTSKLALFERLVRNKQTLSNDQMSAAKELKLEIIDEIWNLHTKNYKFTTVTDTIASIIIIIERCSVKLHAEVVTFLKLLFVESKKLQMLDVTSSHSDAKCKTQKWADEMRRRLDAQERRSSLSTTESVKSSDSGRSEHTPHSSKSQSVTY